MHITIYIQKDLEEQFKQEEGKSKLINDLLRDYYKNEPSSGLISQGTPKPLFRQPSVRNKTPDTPIQVNENMFVAEPEDDPYKNLVADITGNTGVWDTETEERVDADPEMIKELKRRGQTK